MNLLGKYFKQPANATQKYDHYLKVNHQYGEIVTCLCLTPQRPFYRHTTITCDANELAQSKEISSTEYFDILKSII